MSNKLIKVVCAIININNKILAVQRSQTMNQPLKWEFPGGKIEPGESFEDCIKREIKEELNIEIVLLKRLSTINHDYPNFSIQLIPFQANYLKGNFVLKEHKQYKLLNKEELDSLDWADADLPIVKELQEL
ncbi:MAG: DNA mismatch repair protein MutT [Flavobacteriaceae bacterium]|nr:DNA mismatch repair protein MutT [Flavobacteriaceae bacterium]|tara:strand:- start:201 stop:593 length:393 start_codon:yes stop_codon:yes gene_type:complete